MSEWTCSYCLGKGCEECDGKGKRYRQTWETPDGVVSVTGCGEFPAETKAAFEALVKAACDQMDAEARPSATEATTDKPATEGGS